MEALLEASEVLLEEASEEVSEDVFKGQFKATMMRYRFFKCKNLLRGLKNNLILSSILIIISTRKHQRKCLGKCRWKHQRMHCWKLWR